MGGIRAIRVGILSVGLLGAIASAGCCECCKNLWGGEKAVPASESRQPAVLNNGPDESRLTPQTRQGDSKGETYLTVDRVQGGIY
jgi:hypothetical protein